MARSEMFSKQRCFTMMYDDLWCFMVMWCLQYQYLLSLSSSLLGITLNNITSMVVNVYRTYTWLNKNNLVFIVDGIICSSSCNACAPVSPTSSKERFGMGRKRRDGDFRKGYFLGVNGLFLGYFQTFSGGCGWFSATFCVPIWKWHWRMSVWMRRNLWSPVESIVAI